MVSPLPRSGDVVCSKCPLSVHGRRYRMTQRTALPPFSQKTSGRQRATISICWYEHVCNSGSSDQCRATPLHSSSQFLEPHCPQHHSRPRRHAQHSMRDLINSQPVFWPLPQNVTYVVAVSAPTAVQQCWRSMLELLRVLRIIRDLNCESSAIHSFFVGTANTGSQYYEVQYREYWAILSFL